MKSTPLIVLLCLATPAAAQTTRSDQAGELERALTILRRLDAVTASVNYVDTPLEEVVDDLNWFLDVPLTADWDALVSTGVEAETAVTLRLEDVPLSTILAAVAFQLGTGFDRPRVEVFEAQMLVFTSEEASERMRITDVYDVRDLLADGRAADELRRTAPSRGHDVETEGPAPTSAPTSAPSSPGDTEGEGAAVGGTTTQPGWRLPPREAREGDSAPTPRRRRVTPGEELMNLICEHVDPDAWIEYGGTRASIGERDGVLMVSAAPSVHRDFQDAIRRLRRAFASQVTVRATIVDIPRARFERLARRHELSSAALVRSILAADDVDVLYRAAASAELGKTLVSDSRRGGVTVHLDFRANLDRATGLLTVEVNAECRHDDDERRVSTTVTIPYRQGGATIELPAATAGDSVRLLVMIPERG